MCTKTYVFLSYAPEDEALTREFLPHLKVLQRQMAEPIEVKSRLDIPLGKDVEQEARTYLDDAHIVLLLISASFLESDDCFHEMERAMERSKRDHIPVIPILLKSVVWENTLIRDLRVLPRDGKPIANRLEQQRDGVFTEIASEVRQLIMAQRPSPPLITQIDMPPKTGADRPTEAPAVSLLKTFNEHTKPVTCLALSNDGSTLVSSSWDKTIKIWNLSSWQVSRTLADCEWVQSHVLSADNSTIISGGWDKTIKIWNIYTGRLIDTLKEHTGAVYSISMNYNAQKTTFATGSTDGTVMLWDENKGELLRIFKRADGVDSPIYAVALSPDGTTLISGGDEHVLEVWNVHASEEPSLLTGHTRPIYAVAFSSDGHVLASGSTDKNILIWNMRTRTLLHTLRGHSNAVYALAFLGRTQILVSGGADNVLHFWNTQNGALLHTLSGHIGSILSIATSQNGQIFASSDTEGVIKIWQTQPFWSSLVVES